MQVSTQANAQAIERDGRLWYRWIVAMVVILGVFMSILDQTIVNIAMSSLQSTFGPDLPRISSKRAWESNGTLWHSCAAGTGSRPDLWRLSGDLRGLAGHFLRQCAGGDYRGYSGFDLFA